MTEPRSAGYETKPGMTPEQRALRARMGAYGLHAKYDSRATTAAARAAFNARFAREVDPEGVLPAAEREKRAEAARKLYYARIRLKRSQKRRA